MNAQLEARDVWFRYGHGSRHKRENPDGWILQNLNLTIPTELSVGIVGESGSGKSTLVRLLCGLLQPERGTVIHAGRSVEEWLREQPAAFRRRSQIVFQDPSSSFDPRMTLRRSLSEPVRSLEGRSPSSAELEDGLSNVGLTLSILDRYPHQVSGGQLQRIAIARALSVNPTHLFADEPTSALDVSVQSQVLNVLLDLRDRKQLSLIMVAHDLLLVSRVCDHLIVMKDGAIIETGAADELLRRPKTNYTAQLVAAAEAVSLSPRSA